ncbi:CHAT domain-containing protein [Desulfobacula sp.]|uniref:CHAT domain-containing protein n=1 Tax=Candidatus Desulfatibia vada TaxID=2841696 RepID=A0A8J6TWA0_9BACT|nr:CHAT domain-containing protein [Candidatus Desulfatibia vada]MBL6996523.1 CHAT domain-containing protein [Desulfobacula sp.]
MKKTVAILLFLLFLAAFASCVTVAPTYHQNPNTKAYYEANQTAFVQGDLDKGLNMFLELKEVFARQGLKISELSVVSGIAHIYHQKKDFGRSFEWSQTGLKLIDEIERIGINNIDDNSRGGKLSATDQKLGRSNRAMIIATSKSNCLIFQVAYYNQAGESQKAEALNKESKKVHDDLMTTINQSTNKSLEKQLDSIDDKTSPEAQAVEDSKQRTKDIQRKQARLSLLQAEILRTYHQNKTGGSVKDLEDTIDEYAAIAVPLDYRFNMVAQGKSAFQASGRQSDINDFDRIGDYYQRYFIEPWAMAIKASQYYTIGRTDKALALLEQAIRQFESRGTQTPSIKSYSVKALMKQLQSQQPLPDKTPHAWKILYAELLGSQGSPQAVAQWEEIRQALKDTSSKIIGFSMTDQWLRDMYLDMANRELSVLYERNGRHDKALSCLDEILRSRESARATFSVESHKMGYLAGNKRLYERYLTLSAFNPGLNLQAMERAKSRAMVDLMAQGTKTIDEPVFRMLVEQKTAAMETNIPGATGFEKKTGPGKRAIQITQKEIDQELKALKADRPELHSLISVDVSGLKELESIIPETAAVLSYYVTDEMLYINVFGKGKRFAKQVDLSRMGLFNAVYQFRQKIQNPDYVGKPFIQADIDIKRNMENSIETVEITNNMPFPLEIISMTAVLESYHPEMQMFPTLSIARKIQAGIMPQKRSVKAGGSEVVLRRDYNSAFSSVYLEDLYINTNLGHLRLKGLFVIPKSTPDSPGGEPLLVEVDRSTVGFKPVMTSLYDLLISPVEAQLENANVEHLIIVPHNALHFLPFESLKDNEGKYLLQKYSVSYVPSLNVLKYCKAGNRQQKERLVAYGDPLGDLQFAGKEVEQIKSLFPQAHVLSGKQVTKQSVTASIGQGDIIHFACHGQYDAQSPFNSALILSGPGQAPQRLSVSEIMGLKFSPSLVTLSACDTGLARISGGDELIGLVRGFFVAGSPSLVTTLWQIDDESTATLVTRFYENMIQKGMNKAQALREAKLHLIAKGYQTPYYWAAFVLQGDWR